MSTTAAHRPGPVRITPPAHFPVAWERPDDADLFWTFQRMHWPDPMTAMDYEFMGHCRDGINFGLEAYGVPLRYQARLINRYWYYTIGPVAASPAELEFQGRRSRERLEAAMGRIGE